ncbi:MAG: RNA methyltransferase [Acidobacteria bacterium]|nr:RNA methyltransferase [Acidobacteriota bacterium]
MQIITSRHNPIVARFRAAARERRGERRQLLLDGSRLIDAAQRAGVRPETAVFGRGALRRRDGALADLAGRLAADDVTVLAASAPVLSAVSPVRTPSGVVALARHRQLETRRAFAGGGVVLAAAGVQDPGNVGAIIRAADAGGAGGVLVTEGSADPFGWKALRGAMGSTFRLPVIDAGPAPEAVAAAQAHGAGVLAAVPRGGAPLHDIDMTRPWLVLIGGEGGGLSEAASELAEMRISVPMRPGVESLNAAVAAALIVYEARRQRTAAAASQASSLW